MEDRAKKNKMGIGITEGE